MTNPPTEAEIKAARRLARKCGWNLRTVRTGNAQCCHLDRGGADLTGRPYERITGTSRRGEIRPYTLTIEEAEARCWEMRPEFAPRESHPLYAKLEELAARYGGKPQDWAVMSSKSDPFLMDTDTNHAAALWLKNLLDSNRIVVLHDRGVHYVAVSTEGLIRPDGKPYTNTEANWNWLVGVINAARWLNYVSFERITDQKNAEGVFRLRTRPEPKGSVATDFDMYVPGADDLQPTAKLDGFTQRMVDGELVPVTVHPYRIALMGEKSSLERVLGPISDEYNTDLVLFTGNASNRRIWELARDAAKDGRPLIVLYFADCDPWGVKMANEVAWKLLALQIDQFPSLQFSCYRAALTPEQVIEYDLPQSPIEKGKEEEAERWREATGVEQTEIDSIATLRPELLTQITEDWIAYFRDPTLNRRLREAGEGWREQAQILIDAAVNQDALDGAVDDIAEHERDIQAILDERVQPIIDTAEAVTLPALPSAPKPEIDYTAQPEPLIDSDDLFAEQAWGLREDRKAHGVERRADRDD